MSSEKNTDWVTQTLQDSAAWPLTADEAKQVAQAAVGLIICILARPGVEKEMTAMAEQNPEVASLLQGKPLAFQTESVMLGHLALMFPHLTKEEQIRIMTLTAADL